MEISKINTIKDSYNKLKNLKLVGEEIGIPWQTVYWVLKKEGVAVVGDKSMYGSPSDQIAIIGESAFKKSVPWAIDRNEIEFQSCYDFDVGTLKVDVKTASEQREGNTGRWNFKKTKRQESVVDIFVAYLLKHGTKDIENILVIPNDFIKGVKGVTISSNLESCKYGTFVMSEGEMVSFFESFKE